MEATTLPFHPKEPSDPPGKRSYAKVASDHTSELMKNYVLLVDKAKKERNILEIKFSKLPNSTAEGPRRQYIDIETIGEYVSDEMGLKPSDMKELDLSTGTSETKQILLNPHVDPDRFPGGGFPDTYNSFQVSVAKQTHSKTRVTFRNVPVEVPDEEILHLCSFYEEVDNKVEKHYIEIPSKNNGK